MVFSFGSYRRVSRTSLLAQTELEEDRVMILEIPLTVHRLRSRAELQYIFRDQVSAQQLSCMIHTVHKLKGNTYSCSASKLKATYY